MEKVMDFFNSYGNLVMPIIGFIVGLLAPVSLFKKLGDKAKPKMSSDVAKLIAERLDAFADGLYDLDHEGDKGLISNEQLAKGVESLKIELTEGK